MMKSEPKAFASLSSGLLARKGAARPAMRPQGFGQNGSGLDDLGWNDMGFEPPKPSLAPVHVEPEAVAPRANPVTGLSPISPVHAVHEELAQRLTQDTDPDYSEEVDETAEPVAANAPPLAEVLAQPVQPQASPVQSQAAPLQADIAAESLSVTMTKPAARAKVAKPPRERREPGAKGKAAFTLRLDSPRHLKLRLAAAVTGTSAQQLVTRALDLLLGSMPEVDAMAQRAPDRQNSKG